MSREQEILLRFAKAKENNDAIAMMECIVEMKQTDPVFVDIMMNTMYDLEDEDDEDDDD